MNLSAQQLAAVRRTGQNVCVVAGPGSGKTRVLVDRFAWLVEECGIAPGRILAITFTEKAATEMKERLVKRFNAKPELREAVERAWVSTIDGFCNRLLSENAIDAGLPPDFRVLDAPAADRILRESAEEALDGLFAERPEPMRRLMEALDHSTDYGSRQPDLAESLREVYQQMRLAGKRELPEAEAQEDLLPLARRLAQNILADPGFAELHHWAADFLSLPAQPVSLEHFRVLDGFKVNLNSGGKKRPGFASVSQFKKEVQDALAGQWAQEYYSGLPELFGEAISRLETVFSEAKRQQGVTDFADLEELAVALLTSRLDVRNRVMAQFDHVLMDELQDTNRLQWNLVNLLRKNFFAVGDINQSIYGFRHADRTVFEDYRAEVRSAGGHVDELDDNYRSHPTILEAVERVTSGQKGIETRPLSAGREYEHPGEALRIVGEGEDGEAVEAEMVTARILELAGQTGTTLAPADFSRFAILVRTMAATEPFEDALEKSGVPFLVEGGRTFLETRETRDLLNFLAALVNPRDDAAMLGVLRSPLMGWSDEQILAAGREKWSGEFERLFGKVRRLSGFLPPDRLLSVALDECGYNSKLTDRAQANVQKLLGWIRREHGQYASPLAELLDRLESLRSAHAEAEAPPSAGANAVNILSIHNAKGLEFPVVFVSGLHRGVDSHTPVILFSARLGLGMKWRNPASGESAPDQTYTQLRTLRKEQEKAEETRLLYVAMTRAEQRLILSHADRKRASGMMKLALAIDAPGLSGELIAVRPPSWKEQDPGIEYAVKPALTAQFDSVVSATAIVQFQACPRRYYLSRYLGLETEPQAQGTGALDLGTEVHRVLAGGISESPEANQIAERFHLSETGLRAARAARIEREFDFMVPMGEVLVRGQIDLWFEEAGELTVVDYKTDRSETAAADYSLQLRLYAIALERYAGKLPDRAVLCYLRSGNTIEVGLKADDLEGAKQAVQAVLAAQENLEFPMKPADQCLRCGFFKGLCPSSGPFSELPSSAPERPTSGS